MTGPQAGSPSVEFPRPVAVETLPLEGRTLALEATPAECAALADRFGLVALERLSGEATVRPLGSRRGQTRVEVTGRLIADVVQTCVVTLEPLRRHHEETVCLRFSDAAAGPGEAAVDIDPQAEADPPDPLEGGAVDVGEVLAEALGLALDPHPRADGAMFGALEVAPPDDAPAAESPFAALAGLRKGLGDG